MDAPHRLVERIERMEGLDRYAKPLAAAVSRAVQPQVVRNALSGANLGHPLHPVLKDGPIGAWTMSLLLDAVGGPESAQAADLLVGAGIVTAVPAAAAGLNDWSDTTGEDTRVGLAHAAANMTALSLFTASFAARRAGHRGRGKALSLVGFGVLSVGGYLGGHLAFTRGVNVNRTAFERLPQRWTPVASGTEIYDGQPRSVTAGRASVLVYRDGDRLFALANTCTHAGGPLNRGQIVDGCVVCPWHGSTFRLQDGSIVRGPASTPQPAYDVRINDGQIEVRAR